MLTPPNPIARQKELDFRHHVTEAICLMCLGLGGISILIPLIYRTVSPISGIVFTLFAGAGYYLAKFRRRSDIAAYGIVTILFASSAALSSIHGVYGALALFLIVLSIVVAGLIISTWWGVVIFLLQLAILIPLVSRQTKENILLNHNIDMVPDLVMSVCISAIIVLLIHFYTKRLYFLDSQHSSYQKKLNVYTERIESIIESRQEEIRKETEVKTKRLQQLATLGKELSKMTHDMGNTLTALRLTFEQNSEKLSPADREQLTASFEHIDALLTIPRNHRVDLSAHSSLKSALEQCLTILKRRLAREGISIETHVDDAPIALRDDDLKKMLLNLIGNSIDALREVERTKKEIKIAGAFDEPIYTLTIEDNGIGIPAEVLPFLPQSWLSTKGDDHLGLGLSSIEETLTAHPGCGISFASKYKKWTRVSVKLPVFYP